MNNIRVVHISTSVTSGGAALACKRISKTLSDNSIQSTILVYNDKNTSKNSQVEVYNVGWMKRLLSTVRSLLINIFRVFVGIKRGETFSFGVIGSGILNHRIIRSVDIINLHWINGEMLSIRSISRFGLKPLVWTCHDMWPILGGEHFKLNVHDSKLCAQRKTKYTVRELVNKYLKNIKKKYFSRLNTIIVPSTWMEKVFRVSGVFPNANIHVIPIPIDPQTWRPRGRFFHEFGLDSNKGVILFGAVGGTKDIRKGFDLLIDSLQILSKKNEIHDYQIVTFGGLPSIYEVSSIKIVSVGRINSEDTLSRLYSTANVLIVPSRVESFGQTAAEAMACGTPVVAFGGTGIDDIVDHTINGYLAKPYEIEDLARGISWVLNYPDQVSLQLSARNAIQTKFSPDTVASLYRKVYEEILSV